MFRKHAVSRLMRILAVFLLTQLAASARSDIVDDANRLLDQCREQQRRGKYSEAEKTALKLRKLAEGPLKDHPQVLGFAALEQADIYRAQKRYDVAGSYYKWAVEAWGKLLASKTLERRDCLRQLGLALHGLANVYADQDRYAEAQPLLERALPMLEEVWGTENPNVAVCLDSLARVHAGENRFADAERILRRALQMREKAHGPDHVHVRVTQWKIANVLIKAQRYQEAERHLKRVLAAEEESLGKNHPDVAQTLRRLAEVYSKQDRVAEAESTLKRAIAALEKTHGPSDSKLTPALLDLVGVCLLQRKYDDAESHCDRALSILEDAAIPDPDAIADWTSRVIYFYSERYRYDEAVRLAKRGLTLLQKAQGNDTLSVANCMYNLGLLYERQGWYAEAEPLYKRSLAIMEKKFGPDHPQVARSLASLAGLYRNQELYARAEPLYKRALAIHEKHSDGDDPEVADGLRGLGTLYLEQRKLFEAEQLLKRALAIQEKVLPAEHLDLASSLNAMGLLYLRLDKFDEAEAYFGRALTIREKRLGTDHRTLAGVLHNLALSYVRQDRFGEAKQLLAKILEIRENTGAPPGDRYLVCLPLAQIEWRAGNREQAVELLRRAMDYAEEQRAHISGGEHVRAQAFAECEDAFAEMVDWQIVLGDVPAAFEAIERSRARALLDQMETNGIDLLAGLSKEEVKRLRERERKALEQLANLDRQIQVLDSRENLSEDDEEQRRGRLNSLLRQAREEYAAAYADVRNSSPAYRLAIGQERKPVALAKLEQWCRKRKTLLLEYMLGDSGGYVMVVPVEEEPRLAELMISEEQAEILGVFPGPLLAEKIEMVINNEHGIFEGESGGLIDYLKDTSDSKKAKKAESVLATLWDVLVPEKERSAILRGECERLVIIPHGSLARLPFETLVVRPGARPEYLLDIGPPIEYAPSATILLNLAQRPAQDGKADAPPVLTVGNPKYGGKSDSEQGGAGSRYGLLRGKLTPLPYTAWECEWLVDVFHEFGVRSTHLDGLDATEANVRSKSSQRRLIHLACHGLVDQEHGNLFGALALTPGPNTSVLQDDGFLTMAEVYDLDLESTELAILSACDTNYGPQQRGEGVWALSRGFLVAGSRRVVASNWLVDDEAAASLISYYCSILAKAQKNGGKADYADALHKAKVWIRKHPEHREWASPYYWGTFVQIGPH